MTNEQRERLEWLASDLPDSYEADLRAALADLDACRAALRPVAARLYREADGEGWARLTRGEVAAVLAAAGGEERPCVKMKN